MRVKECLDNAGPGWPGLVEAERLGEAAWLLAFDDEIAVAVEWLDEDPSRIAIASPLGVPPIDRRFNVYETLLNLNGLWRENGGVRTSIEAGGEVAIGISTQCADAADLRQVIDAWRAVAVQWRAYVNQPAAALTVPGLNPLFFNLRA